MTEILLGAFSTDFSRPDHKFTPPKTCVLDLDETLVHSWENPIFVNTYNIYKDPVLYRQFHPKNQPQLCYSFDLPNITHKIWGLRRPHSHEFLKFCGEYFDNVLVWSAGITPYVQEITRNLFMESGLQLPKIIWSRPHCANIEINKKSYYHKPIMEIINDLNNKAYIPFQIDLRSTIVVDDRTHTFVQNPQNGVLIPSYYPGKNRPGGVPLLEDLLDRSDNALVKLQSWLQTPNVKSCTDIRLLDKNNIFG